MKVEWKTSGEYAVGTYCMTVIDEKHEETLGTATGKRKLAIRFYYPVDKEDTKNCDKATLLSAKKTAAIEKAFRVPKSESLIYDVECYENAPCSKKTTFPLVFFSHGYQGYVEQNSILCCDIASQGYIIASIGHAYEAVRNDYVDGSFDCYDMKSGMKLMRPFIPMMLALNKLLKKKLSVDEAAIAFEQFQEKYGKAMQGRTEPWVKDTQAVLDELQIKNEDEEFHLAHRIDFSNGVAAFGHSFGGATAYNLCLRDERFTCGINIDGAIYGDNKGLVMKKPFMMIGCNQNRNVEVGAIANNEADAYYIAFEQMQHLGFTDGKYFLTKKYVGTLDRDKWKKELTNCCLRMLNRYLKGDASVTMMKNTDFTEVITRENKKK